MSTHKHIDRICVVVIILSLMLTILFMNGAALGIQPISSTMGYENRLFDTSRVHTIDIIMNDWDSFIDTCENEEYVAASVVIDGESYKNVGIRAKGNTSLSTVSAMNSDRYSFKIEFDQYDSAKRYYGLDKLSLNNLIQDTTYMKDYLTYRLMGAFGVNAPLCSYVYITVNGEEWGLYLAVEGVEDGFMQRNYGNSYGDLYKPDSLSFGGGRGNGMGFNMEEFINSNSESNSETSNGQENQNTGGMAWPDMPEGFDPSSMFGGSMPEGFDPSSIFGGQMPGDFDLSDMFGDNSDFDFSKIFSSMGGMGGSDVKLQYIDDDPDSYSNIFSNAKTDVSSADQKRLIEALRKLSSGEGIEDVVDIDEVIRYFVVHNFVVNGDSYTGMMVHNYYLYEEDGRLSMIPWDYNLAFGTFSFFIGGAGSSVNDPIDTPQSTSGSGDRPMIDWILSNEEYLELYHQYFAEFIENTDMISLIDEAEALIAPYVEKDPTAFYSYEEFESGVETLREFCTMRVQSVRGQLDGTIPSTADGQTADPSALVDAAQLDLSNMGSMGGGFGGGQAGQFGGFPNMGDGQGEFTDMIPPGMGDSEGAGRQFDQFAGNGERPEMPEGMQIPGNFSGNPGNADGRMPFDNPFGGMSEESTRSDANSIILLSVSVAVLLVGLAVAFKFRR